MNEERIKEVFADEEFIKELFSKETPEEAQALLVEKDIELSIDELVKLKDLVVAKLQAVENGESAELTEEELTDVAGGYLGVATIVIVSIVIPLVTAGGIAVGIGTDNFTSRFKWRW
jgi:hypothetical protein